MEQLKSLEAVLAGVGFDIVAPFKVKDYNDLVHKRWLLEEMITPEQGETSLALVIGSSRRFWPFFLAWLKDQPSLPADPIDTYCTQTIEKIVHETYSNITHELVHSWSSPSTRNRRFAHMQTAGHVAGVAHYDKDTYWSIHERYGSWFVYRTIVVFALPFPQALELPKPAPLLSADEKAALVSLTKQAKEENWNNQETLLSIRNVPTVGRDHSYQGDLLEYFYPLGTTKQAVIQRVFDSLRAK